MRGIVVLGAEAVCTIGAGVLVALFIAWVAAPPVSTDAPRVIAAIPLLILARLSRLFFVALTFPAPLR